MDPNAPLDDQALQTRAVIGLVVATVGAAIAGGGCVLSLPSIVVGLWFLLPLVFLFASVFSGAGLLLWRPPGELRMPEGPIATTGLLTSAFGCLLELFGGCATVLFFGASMVLGVMLISVAM